MSRSNLSRTGVEIRASFEEVASRRRERAVELLRETFARRATVVYVVEAVGVDRVKIGESRKIGNRMSCLQVSCPVPLLLHGIGWGNDSGVHDLLSRFNIRPVLGEWFEKKQVLEGVGRSAIEKFVVFDPEIFRPLLAEMYDREEQEKEDKR